MAKYISSKALLPHREANSYCKGLKWSLAKVNRHSIRSIKSIAWVKAPTTQEIPAGKALLYKQADGNCCHATSLTTKCRREICDQLAPALCYRK
jgi:hypothetical protein